MKKNTRKQLAIACRLRRATDLTITLMGAMNGRLSPTYDLHRPGVEPWFYIIVSYQNGSLRSRERIHREIAYQYPKEYRIAKPIPWPIGWPPRPLARFTVFDWEAWQIGPPIILPPFVRSKIHKAALIELRRYVE